MKNPHLFYTSVFGFDIHLNNTLLSYSGSMFYRYIEQKCWTIGLSDYRTVGQSVHPPLPLQY